MKRVLLTTAAIAALQVSSMAAAEVVRGVNYDPVHSFQFSQGVALDDKALMESAIMADLDKLAYLQNYNNGQFKSINHLKTFFTVFASAGSKMAPGPDHRDMVFVNIADVVARWNQTHASNPIKLALGVYEFRPGPDACTSEDMCVQWTQAQVQGAIDAYNKYGSALIDRIIVGNEDIGSNGENNPTNDAMKARLTNDIATIKKATNNQVPVGTAQTSGTVEKMLENPTYPANEKFLNVTDFLGANPYPFWNGITYGATGAGSDTVNPVKIWMTNYLNTINSKKGKTPVIVTEEGWPSAGNNLGSIGSVNFQHDYFYYWFQRDFPDAEHPQKVPLIETSYLFALFDKLPGQGVESNWGIFSADGYSNALDMCQNGCPQPGVNKSLAPQHPMVKFINNVGAGTPKPRVAGVNGCVQDVNQPNQECHPIYGFDRSGDIGTGANNTRAFMVDTEGKTYKSLQVVYYGDNGAVLQLCWINNAVLQTLKNSSVVTLTWINDSGNVACNVKL